MAAPGLALREQVPNADDRGEKDRPSFATITSPAHQDLAPPLTEILASSKSRGGIADYRASQRRRMGFSTAPARRAVAKFIVMMMTNTAVHEP